ncbi:pseudouridine synthase [Celeribacter indicus]|uniref:Pseudouridine synthase n=1 Tax=Celeribacter indicus TaxID=1208324 RepID=A0A0B5DYI6_9RHOB|nr:pseudouridine synthase [Celeribacter indicus]AJE46220.1 Pseudouridine synthase [Celeribacter indicus]SDW50305.1 23S rRNA pseudouridine2605 synthase [Celeribacter indicus]
MDKKRPSRPASPSSEAPKTPGTPPGERIAKVLSRAGIASRRDAEAMIAEGRVTVNGRTVASPALNVMPKDRIFVDGKEVGEPEPPRLWLYHKPAGLVTTAKDEKGRETVFDKLPADLPRVMTVGRLDLSSEGLLLLTNDGEIKRRLELPDTGWLRKYRVRVKGTASEAMLEPLRHGVVIDGEEFQPMEVVFDRQQGANAWLTVGLREGKNREIRRAMEHIGLTVNRLIRISYGPFRLGTLAPGAVEEVRGRVLRDQLGLEREEDGKPRRDVMRKGKGGPRTETPGRDPRPGKPGPKPRSAGFKAQGDRPDRPARGDRPAGTGPRAEGGKPGPFKRREDSGKPGGFRRRDGAGKPEGAKTREGDSSGAPRRREGGDKPGGFKSRGFKSHGGPKGGKSRSAGFKSHNGPKGGGKPPKG